MESIAEIYKQAQDQRLRASSFHAEEGMRKWRKRVGIGLLWVAIVAVASAQPQRATLLNETGLAAVRRGDYSAGAKALSEALAIWRSLGPDYTPHTAIEMMNLGDAICAEGNWSEGAKMFEEALDLSRRSMGAKNLRTVVDMNRLANVYLLQGEIDRAEALYREALAVERELYPNDLQTAHSLAGLASVHTRARQWDTALPEAEEGLAITLRAVGENDRDSGMAYSNVAEIYRVMGQTDRALPLLHKAEAILERTLGPANSRFASVLSQEGLALMSEHKYVLAEQDLARAVDLLSKFPGAQVELAVADHNLGLLRLRQKKYIEADRLLTEALSLEEQYSVKPGSEMAATLAMLAQVREKENRPADATQLKARANTITSYR